VSLPETPTERLMLEALLRDERTGPPSAVAIQSALQALVPTPPAAVALDPAGAGRQAAAAGTALVADGQHHSQHRPQDSQQQQAMVADARPSLKEQAQARRAARRQSQVCPATHAALRSRSFWTC
jgi:hypothetical protein